MGAIKLYAMLMISTAQRTCGLDCSANKQRSSMIPRDFADGVCDPAQVVNDWAEVVPEYENSEEWKGEEHGNGTCEPASQLA
jgi:hypothetical protein